MLFNSSVFLLFFVIVTTIYFLLPHKLRWVLLLAASCFFYMFFKPEYILILFFTIIVDYYAGLLIEKTTRPRERRGYLIMSLVVNIGTLALFKYYNFINTNVSDVLLLFGVNNPVPFLKMILPIGLSFHTFQAMSYTIEVYRENQKAERHFGIYALYVMFYPQLVAGPIERPQNILHQFHEKKSFDGDRVAEGLQLMLLGYFKKVVVADRLALYVDSVYAHPNYHNSLSTTIALVFYAFQIYCDFSGYSDIALGTAKVMGFDLMKNFNLPFSSKNITEFWRKWHISLSTWFNDYLFTPIMVAKRDWGKSAVVFSLFITFFISGLWHGAGWTFAIFGILHGLVMIFEFLTKKQRSKVRKKMPSFLYDGISQVLTFTTLCLIWVFFRSENFNKVEQIFGRLFSFDFRVDVSMFSVNAETGTFSFLLSWLVIGALLILEKKYTVKYSLPFALVTLFLIIFLGEDVKNTFIYFQF